jgi:hypothetical protein
MTFLLRDSRHPVLKDADFFPTRREKDNLFFDCKLKSHEWQLELRVLWQKKINFNPELYGSDSFIGERQK